MPSDDQIETAAENVATAIKEKDTIKVDKKVKVEAKINNYHRGLDVGTMNLVSAKMDSNNNIATRHLRNVFLEIDADHAESIDLSTISNVRLDDKIYFLSDDAYNFANAFDRKVMRPMQAGTINSTELDSIDILSVMVQELIGKGTAEAVCCYSIPANPIDSDINVLYHESVFKRIIAQLGYNPVALNEAVAVIYSECSDNGFTGIGISFGSGMTNVAVVFKSIPVLEFSILRGGDWIDENAARAVGMVSNRVNRVKEKDSFNLNNFSTGKKQEIRIKEALVHYYRSLIEHTTKNIANKLNTLTVDFPDEVPVIVSGGTSKANGFVDMVINILDAYEFPFDISEIRSANNPLTAVAEGCLIRALK